MSWKTIRNSSLLRHAQTPSSSGPSCVAIEDRAALRLRTSRLVDLLLDLPEAGGGHQVLGVVTHKGFLRELERGPLGQPDATEFGNCEVRAYSLTLDRALRVIKSVEKLELPEARLEAYPVSECRDRRA